MKVPIIPDGGEDPPGAAKVVVGLRRDVDRLTGDVGRLDGDVASHTRAITELANAIKMRSDQAAAPIDWLTIDDPAAAVAALDDLAVWVARVWSAWGPITRCWAWHPTAVAELLAVRALHAVVHSAGGGPEQVAAWHDRWRPGAHNRLTREVLASCENSDGHLVGVRVHRVDITRHEELAAWWATTHGNPAAAPGLS